MDTETRRALLRDIHKKRYDVNLFVMKKERWGNRLIIASIICAAIASVLSIVKAAGLWPQAGGLGQTVLILTAVLSTAATAMTTIYRQWVTPSRLVEAQTSNTDLQNLELEVRCGDDLEKARDRYMQITSKVSFIPERDPELAQVTGRINKLAADPTVAGCFNCSGAVENMSDGLHLWLAVMNQGGRLWPKDNEFSYSPGDGSPGDGSWEKQIKAEGSSEESTVALLVTNDRANKEIYKWLARCNRKSSYPAFWWPRKGGIFVLGRGIVNRRQGARPEAAP